MDIYSRLEVVLVEVDDIDSAVLERPGAASEEGNN
jgi:hypothetical protein